MEIPFISVGFAVLLGYLLMFVGREKLKPATIVEKAVLAIGLGLCALILSFGFFGLLISLI